MRKLINLKYTSSGRWGNKELYKISNGLYVSQLQEFSVADYNIGKEQNCNKLHNVNGGVSVCSVVVLSVSQRKFKKKEWSKLDIQEVFQWKYVLK